MTDPIEAATETCKALLIDSDLPRLASINDVLKNCGFIVETATDLNSAEHYLKTGAFDAVLCQETLNGGSGIDLLKVVRKERPESSCILMAGSSQSPSVAIAISVGAEVFTTPGDFSTLYPKLAAIQSKANTRAKAGPRMTAHPIQLPELQPGLPRGERANVDMILDVPVTVNAVLGTTSMVISDLLQLGPGSVVELNKRAGEPVDLYVNDKLVAVGEVVVVNDTFGIRITEVIDANQRVQALG